MPTPDTNGLPPFADFEMMKSKINELVQKYNNLLVNLDSLNVVSLTADHIDTGTLDANLVTIRSDLTAGAYVQIDGNGMVINNGSFNTFTADIHGQVTMTRALIQSNPSGYPRIVMDPTGNFFGAYITANNYLQIASNSIFSTTPTLLFSDPSGQTGLYTNAANFFIESTKEITMYSPDDINIVSGGNLYLPNWTMIRNSSTLLTLQDAFNEKATYGNATTADGAHNHGIPNGTVLMVEGGGTVTFTAAGNHVHSQT